MKARSAPSAWLVAVAHVLALLVALALLPVVVLCRAARRVNWLAVASDLALLFCAAGLVFTAWLAVNIVFTLGA